MEEKKKDMFEIIEETITQTDEPNLDLMRDAEELAKELYAKPKKSHRNLWLTIHASVLACVILVFSIFFFNDFFNTDLPETRYFDEQNIEINNLEDLPAFLVEKNITINYFKKAMIMKNSVANILETGELAMILQEFTFISSSGLEPVELYVNLLPNSTYKKLELFKDLPQNKTIESFSVSYDIKVSNDNKNIIRAKFVDKNEYYIQITTKKSESKLEEYIKLLLSN